MRTDNSSSSSDATLELIEDRAPFAAAQSRCANILIFGRKGLPGDVFVRATAPIIIQNPIILERSFLASGSTSAAPIGDPAPTATLGLEIVPWKPIRDAIALQLIPHFRECQSRPRAQKETGLVIILAGLNDMQTDESLEENSIAENNSATLGPEGIRIQSQSTQGETMPNLPARGQKGKVVTAKKKNVTLPTLVSASSASTPLTQSSVRCSSRRSSHEGYCMVRL